MSKVDLSVEIAGVRFKNPVAAASGVITRSVQSVEGCIKAGASAIVTKSISFVSGVSGGKWLLPRPAIWLLDKYGDPGSSQNISIGNFKLHTDVTCAHFDRLEKAGAAGHTIYSLFPATVIDIETGMPILPFPSPYYGRGISAHENYQTARLAALTNCPIITSGGTMTPRDVISRLMCGASVIEVMTAAMRYGSKIFSEMVDGLEDFMIRKGYASLQDIRGISVPHVNNPEEYARFVTERQVPREAMTMTIDRVKCVGYAQCSVCPYGAMDMQDGFPKWNARICEFCGLCQTICPTDAITIRRRK